jgi:hypothetical protein
MMVASMGLMRVEQKVALMAEKTVALKVAMKV